MMSYKFNFINLKVKAAYFGSGAIAVAAPLALVIACGKVTNDDTDLPKPSNPAEVAAATYLANSAKVLPDAESTHNNVLWAADSTAPDLVVANYAPLSFSTKNYPNARAALSSPASDWTLLRPTQVSSAFLERNLWVRLNPLVTSQNAGQVLNVTTSSTVRQIKIDVATLPAYASLNLATAALGGDVNAPVVNNALSSSLSQYLKLEWEVADSWISSADFGRYITNNKTLITANFVRSMRVRAVSSDVSKYFLAPVIGRPLTTSFTPYTPVVTTDPQSDVSAYLTAIKKYTYDPATSTHSNIAWNGSLPTIASSVTNYLAPEYSTENFDSAGAALSSASSLWKSTIPQETDAVVANRHLWVRVRPVNVSAQTPAYVEDLTISSQLKDLKVQIDTLPAYLNFNLNQVGLSGNYVEGTSVTNPLPTALADYLAMEFSFDNTTWLSTSGLTSYITNNASEFNDRVKVSTLQTRLRALDSSRSVFRTTSAPTLLTSFKSTNEYAAPLYALRETYVANVNALGTTSVPQHNQINWAQLRSLSAELATYYNAPQFSTASFDSAEAALASDNTLWAPNLPTSVNPYANQRSLWMRILPRTTSGKLQLTPYALNITNKVSGSIVKTSVNNLINYATLASTTINLSGISANPALTNLLRAPLNDFIEPRFVLGNSGLLSAAEFIDFLKANAKTLSLSNIQSARAIWDMKDSATTLFNNPPTVTFTKNGFLSGSGEDPNDPNSETYKLYEQQAINAAASDGDFFGPYKALVDAAKKLANPGETVAQTLQRVKPIDVFNNQATSGMSANSYQERLFLSLAPAILTSNVDVRVIQTQAQAAVLAILAGVNEIPNLTDRQNAIRRRYIEIFSVFLNYFGSDVQKYGSWQALAKMADDIRNPKDGYEIFYNALKSVGVSEKSLLDLEKYRTTAYDAPSGVLLGTDQLLGLGGKPLYGVKDLPTEPKPETPEEKREREAKERLLRATETNDVMYWRMKNRLLQTSVGPGQTWADFIKNATPATLLNGITPAFGALGVFTERLFWEAIYQIWKIDLLDPGYVQFRLLLLANKLGPHYELDGDTVEAYLTMRSKVSSVIFGLNTDLQKEVLISWSTFFAKIDAFLNPKDNYANAKATLKSLGTSDEALRAFDALLSTPSGVATNYTSGSVSEGSFRGEGGYGGQSIFPK